MSRAAWFLLVLGLLQIVADLCGLQSVKAIAAVTAPSPGSCRLHHQPY